MTGRMTLYSATRPAASVISAGLHRRRSAPMPSAPAMAEWNRNRSGNRRPVIGFGLSVTQAIITWGA